MRCLHCGKPLHNTDHEREWHRRCIRSFFHTQTLPVLEIGGGQLERIAEESMQEGITVPGVQKKLSLHLSTEKEARLTIRNYPAGFILKPPAAEFPLLPEAEHLVMCFADYSGIATVRHALIRMENGTGDYGYITRRIDRVFPVTGNEPQVKTKYAMEDFCQLEERLAGDKYRGSYERCAAVIRKYSSRPGLDLSEFFIRIVFCFLTGNSDMHLKNFSLIEVSPESRRFVLSPAYDLLPVNVLLPEDRDETALSLNGKKRNITKKDILSLAHACDIAQKTALRLIEKLVLDIPQWEQICEASGIPDDFRQNLFALIHKREKILA